MKTAAIVILTVACTLLTVKVSWQNHSVTLSLQEALAKETCESCSDCFKDKWEGGGEQCEENKENKYYCGAIQVVGCGTDFCPIKYCHRPCYEGCE